ncbi:MAG: hypothetical protein WA992_07190, partial [Desulfobulbales bacterium]
LNIDTYYSKKCAILVFHHFFFVFPFNFNIIGLFRPTRIKNSPGRQLLKNYPKYKINKEYSSLRKGY